MEGGFTSHMADANLKERTARGMLWSILGNGAQQVVVMLIGIALARMLDVAEYGLVAMLTVFSLLAANLQEGGFTSALAVRKEATHEDFNSVFWCSAMMSAAIYGMLWWCAPYIAAFNHAPELTLLARVMFVGFFITSLGISHVAWLFRNLRVREKTTAQVSASIISGLIGMGCAWQGCGVWSLIAMDLSYKLVHTALAWYWSAWRPTLHIDLRPAWRMFGFGSRLLLTNVLTTLNNQLLQGILGHYYPSAQVGQYSQANKWNTLGINVLGGMMNSVAQPVLAQVGDDGERQTRVFRKMLRFTSMLAFPAMMGLALIAPEFIPLVLGAKWAPCVPYLQVLCLGGAFTPICSVFSNLMISKERSDYHLVTTSVFLICQLGLVLAFTSLAGRGGQIAETPSWIVAITAHAEVGLMPLLIAVAALQPLWLVSLAFAARRLGVVRMEVLAYDVAPFLLVAMGCCLGGWIGAVLSTSHTFGILMLKIVFTASLYCVVMAKARVEVFYEALEFLNRKFRK